MALASQNVALLHKFRFHLYRQQKQLLENVAGEDGQGFVIVIVIFLMPSNVESFVEASCSTNFLCTQ